MKREQRLLSRFLRKTDLPPEIDAHRFSVQWFGSDECLIEQHRGILCFDASRIRFSTEQGVLSVEGRDLVLRELTETDARILGSVNCISLEEKS